MIRCAICDKPVDAFVKQIGPEMRGREIVAYCHGDRDIMFLSEEDLQNMGPDEARQIEHGEGIAFTTKRVTA